MYHSLMRLVVLYHFYTIWRVVMGNMSKNYIEIEDTSGFSIVPFDRYYTDSLPDTIISNKVIELQEFYYSSEGRGRRITYSYRPITSLVFNSSYPLSPLKAKLHKHDYFELIFIASDRLEMQIESSLCEFNKGDVCVLNRSTRHAEHFYPGVKMFYLAFSPEYLLNWPFEEGMGLQQSLILTKLFKKWPQDTLKQNKDYVCARYNDHAGTSPLNEIIGHIRREFKEKRSGYQSIVRGLLYRFLSSLADPKYYTTEYIDLVSDEGFSLAYSVKQILDKKKHKMTVLQVANCLNYNSEYINRVFKKHYGKTIPEYNKTVYMRQSALLLNTTGLPIHEICKQLGFTNRTHFYNEFEKEYGCTPNNYRIGHIKEIGTSQSDL